jgi:hypothetical protein
LVWEKFAPSTGLSAPVFTLIICLTGGLVVGLLLQLMGDYSAIFAEIMAEFAKTSRIDYHHAISLVVVGFPSLIFGGSLGPEAPLADATGGMGTWLAEKLKYNDQERRSLTFSGISAILRHGGCHESTTFFGPFCYAHLSKGGGSGNCHRHSLQFYVYHVFFHIAKT